MFALAWLLTALSVAPAAAEPLTLWHSYRGAEEGALNSLLREWNEAHPDAPVEPLAIPFGAYATKLTAAIPRGHGPDLFIHAHERIGDWARSGLIRPLSAVDVGAPKALGAEVDKALRFEGAIHGIPLALKSLALFVNRSLLPDPPETLPALLEAARTLRKGDQYGLAYEVSDFYRHAAWLHGYGGSVMGEGGNPVLDSPAFVKSLGLVERLATSGVLPAEPTSALVAQLFNSGRAAIVVEGPWFRGDVNPDIDLAIVPFPKMASGERARPFLTVEAALISARSEQPERALELARFLAWGHGAVERLMRGGQIVADDGAWEFAEISPRLWALRDACRTAVAMPNHPAMRSVWEPGGKALRSVIRGDRTPQEAAERAQRELDVVSRPAPTPADPTGLAIGGALLLLLGLVFGVRWLRRPEVRAGIRAGRRAYLYVAPAVLGMVVLVFIPFVVGTAVAFFSHRGGEFTFVGLANFMSILGAEDFPVTDPLSFYFTLAVTVLWTTANVALHVAIGLSLALLLREPWLRMKGIYRVLLIVPWAVPNYITALIWKGMFHSQFGAINAALVYLGIEPVPWFSAFWTSFAANLVTNAWLGFPFMMVVCLGALQTLPPDLDEAARLDGAGPWTRFWRVTLPLIRPALVPAVILGCVWTFNMFNIIYLVSGGAPDGSTEILVTEAYRWAFHRQEQYGYAAAYATLIFMALVGYTLFTQRISAGGERA
jgi:arabinogalactan oligomer/maltooligosaccharide transport system permease protein